ncbi:hypothetical protein F5880DRAFT_1619479, partial [Lentinula raphanica]
LVTKPAVKLLSHHNDLIAAAKKHGVVATSEPYNCVPQTEDTITLDTLEWPNSMRPMAVTPDIAPPLLYHTVTQGALAIEIRSDDAEALATCQKLTDRETAWRCLAETSLFENIGRRVQCACRGWVSVDVGCRWG